MKFKLKNAIILGVKRHEVGEVVEMTDKQAKRFGDKVVEPVKDAQPQQPKNDKEGKKDGKEKK